MEAPIHHIYRPQHHQVQSGCCVDGKAYPKACNRCSFGQSLRTIQSMQVDSWKSATLRQALLGDVIGYSGGAKTRDDSLKHPFSHL